MLLKKQLGCYFVSKLTSECVFLLSRRTFPLSASSTSGLFDLLDFIPAIKPESTHFSRHWINNPGPASRSPDIERPSSLSKLQPGRWGLEVFILDKFNANPSIDCQIMKTKHVKKKMKTLFHPNLMQLLKILLNQKLVLFDLMVRKKEKKKSVVRMFARRHTGINLILPRQDKHKGGWRPLRANQASLESARQVGGFGPPWMQTRC